MPDIRTSILDAVHAIAGSRYATPAFLLFAFLFRLGYGLCSDLADSDSVQIYLLGLKFYTTGQWPYFGPDVVWGDVQVPGALQGLLVGGPLYVAPFPEAPYVLLNLLSFGALCLLAWYALKRLPDLPRWFVLTWILLCPWVLNLSTNIYNPSYLLAGSAVFFVGMLETLPATRSGVIDGRFAAAMMGFGIGWTMQLHLSWVLLPPFAILALLCAAFAEKRFGLVAWSLVGLLVTCSTLIPTYLAYGTAATGGSDAMAGFNTENLTALPGIIRRVISLGAFDVSNYLGRHTADRIAFFEAEPWALPAVIAGTLIGVIQGIGMVVMWFRDRGRPAGWRWIKALFAFTIVLIYASFLLSQKPPQSNHVFVVFPLAMIYSLYCWQPLLERLVWRRVAAVLVASTIITHLGIALYNLPRISLYTIRDRVQAAIDQKDYRVMAERRPNSKY